MNIKFQDNAEFQSINSTIYTTENAARLGFHNNSLCNVSNSNMSRVEFTGSGETRFTFIDSEVYMLFIGGEAAATLRSSRVYNVYPAISEVDSYRELDITKTKVEAYDSTIEKLTTYYVNSTVTIIGPINTRYDNWNSLDQLTEGGKGFNVTLHRTSISKLTVYGGGCYMDVRNVTGLYDVGNSGETARTTVMNSTIPKVSVGTGGGTIDGCRVGSLRFRGGGDYLVSGSRVGYLIMHYTFGTLSLDKVKVDMLTGYDLNCTLAGAFSIENKTVQGIVGFSQVERVYPIQALRGINAAPDVDLRLYNETGSLLWSGRTDGNGRANLSVTFHQDLRTIDGVDGPLRMDFAEDEPRFSDELKLVAGSDTLHEELSLRLTDDTPILVVFPAEPERPVYAQGWFLQGLGAVLAASVIAMFFIKRKS